MKKYLFISLVFISLSTFAQKQPYVPFRTNGSVMVKDSLLAVGKLLIPTFTANSITGLADRWGQSFGLNRTNSRLSVRGNGSFLEYPSYTEVQSMIPATTSYIQNGTSQQASSNFNISGTGEVGGIFTANTSTAGGVGGSVYLKNPNATTTNSSVELRLNPSSTTIRYAAIRGVNDGSNNVSIVFAPGAGSDLTDKVWLNGVGKLGIGVSTPSAFLHLKAGTASALTAPLKFNSGPLMTNPEVGAIEFLADSYYATITTGLARRTFAFLESPALTGSPTAPTQTAIDNSTKLATTAYVTSAILANSIVNTTTTALSSATLNSTYGSVPVGYRVICHLITGAPAIYTKATENGSSDVWLTTTATTTP